MAVWEKSGESPEQSLETSLVLTGQVHSLETSSPGQVTSLLCLGVCSHAFPITVDCVSRNHQSEPVPPSSKWLLVESLVVRTIKVTNTIIASK